MSGQNGLETAIDAIYEALKNDNHEIDLRIKELKDALKSAGQTEAILEPTKLAQNNRQGRKLLQSYFKKRGVKVQFAQGE